LNIFSASIKSEAFGWAAQFEIYLNNLL